MQDHDELVDFYEDAYSQDPQMAPIYERWRALGALGKAEHVIGLCTAYEIHPRSTLEVGCGDGALLRELSRRGFGGSLHGVEITAAAVQIARAHPEIESVEVYDGEHLPVADGHYDLGVLSHVLEHVPEPATLLAEVARACRAVLIEVPLEENLSAIRSSKRRHAREIGHLHRLSCAETRGIVQRAGLRVVGELEDPLPLQAHRYFATTWTARTRATVKWATRLSIHRLCRPLARRLFTVHYACLCLPAE
jgi:SAM-dependent methyltransferase